jgi:arabinan endo-1,5-alpha-L-arabinosidase
LLLLGPSPADAQQGDIRHVHDPCIIAFKGSFVLFCTGKGIPIRRSQDLFNWERIGSVFGDVPDWAKADVPGAKDLWAPDISYFNGEYHLYYAVSTFGHNRSCIGLAVNSTLDPASPGYHWADRGKVVESFRKDDWNAIDPCLTLDEREQPWLAFGSFWSGIKLRRVDFKTGKPSPDDSNMHSLAARPRPGAVEAPFFLRKNRFFYLFVSFDFACKGADSTYKVKVGRSRSVTGPFVDRDGAAMLTGGGTLVLAGYGDIRGPGHNAVLSRDGRDWLVHHYYDASEGGIPKLRIRPLVWDDDGWPLAGEPISAPLGSAAPADPKGVCGVWEHSVNFGKGGAITFCPNGRINKEDDPATWSLKGSRLTLTWPRADAPGGAWIDKCIVSEDGRWYVGRNQNGLIIRGIGRSGD